MNKEEIIKEIEHIANCELYDTIGVKYLRLNIEKLFEENKELKEELVSANESITWWNNRFNAVARDNKQLKDNWNKLKEYMIKEQAKIVIENLDEDEFIYTDLLNKMQELERSDSE